MHCFCERILAGSPELHNSDISKLLGLGWKEMADGEKQRYYELQAELSRQHALQFPGYRYRPRPRRNCTVNGKRVKKADYKALIRDQKKLTENQTE